MEVLSPRDQLISQMLQFMADSILEESGGESVESLGSGCGDHSADQALDNILRKTEKFLGGMPIVFQTKYGATLKNYIVQRKTLAAQQKYVIVPKSTPDMYIMSEKYRRAFNAWVDASDCISFVTTHPSYLRLEPRMSFKDLFILHLFAFATCERQYNDGLLSLAITGKSTVGKSTLFENPLLAISYSYLSDTGCGRFDVSGRSAIIASDISLEILVYSKDSDRLRQLCRAEVAKAKVHSSERTIPAMFMIVTSNQYMHTHSFDQQQSEMYGAMPLAKAVAVASTSAWMTNQFVQKSAYSKLCQKKMTYPSTLTPKVGTRRAEKIESVVAIQNRFLEAFCRKKPPIAPEDLPEAGTVFTRYHLVFGLFERVFDIVSSHKLEDFGSIVLYKYVVYALKSILPEYLRCHGIENSLEHASYEDAINAWVAVVEEPAEATSVKATHNISDSESETSMSPASSSCSLADEEHLEDGNPIVERPSPLTSPFPSRSPSPLPSPPIKRLRKKARLPLIVYKNPKDHQEKNDDDDDDNNDDDDFDDMILHHGQELDQL